MNTKLLSSGATILLVLGALIGINSHYTVKTGEAAIISKFGKITDVKYDGLHLEIAKKKKEIAKALKEEKEIVIKTMEMEANTLNDKVLKKMFIEKWDGKLPTTMTDSEIVKVIK